jgi:hypothetical protein
MPVLDIKGRQGSFDPRPDVTLRRIPSISSTRPSSLSTAAWTSPAARSDCAGSIPGMVTWESIPRA